MTIAAASPVRVNEKAVEVQLPGESLQRLTHAQVAELTDYDAVALGLPRLMDALVSVHLDGRIDLPDFEVHHRIEPFSQMHPWPVYQRIGSLVVVGERMLRLNRYQYRLYEALQVLSDAGDNVALRLAAWPDVRDALHAGARNGVLVQGDMPLIRILRVAALPASAMTRLGRQLVLASAVPDASWAMDSGHCYYLPEF